MKWLVGPAALVAMLALASGCTTDTNATLYIKFNQPFTTGCDIPDGSGHTFQQFGQLDVTEPLPGTQFANPGYLLAAAVQNAAVATTAIPNAHQFYIKGADVQLLSSGSAASTGLINALAAAGLDKRTQYLSGLVEPGASAGLGVYVIDATQTEFLNGALTNPTPIQIITRTQLFGTIDYSDTKADPFDFPVTVCNGCAVGFLGACSAIPPMTTIHKGGTCNILQDGVVDCCTSATGALVCPAVAPTM